MNNYLAYVVLFSAIGSHYLVVDATHALKDAEEPEASVPLPLEGTPFFIFRKKLTWFEAKHACKTSIGRLAAPLSEWGALALFDAIRKISVPYSPGYDRFARKYEFGLDRRYWIGLNDLETEGDWTWTDTNGTKLRYNLWYPKQPDRGWEHCVSLWNPGYYAGESHSFNNDNCDTTHYYICEKVEDVGKNVDAEMAMVPSMPISMNSLTSVIERLKPAINVTEVLPEEAALKDLNKREGIEGQEQLKGPEEVQEQLKEPEEGQEQGNDTELATITIAPKKKGRSPKPTTVPLKTVAEVEEQEHEQEQDEIEEVLVSTTEASESESSIPAPKPQGRGMKKPKPKANAKGKTSKTKPTTKKPGNKPTPSKKGRTIKADKKPKKKSKLAKEAKTPAPTAQPSLPFLNMPMDDAAFFGEAFANEKDFKSQVTVTDFGTKKASKKKKVKGKTTTPAPKKSKPKDIPGEEEIMNDIIKELNIISDKDKDELIKFVQENQGTEESPTTTKKPKTAKKARNVKTAKAKKVKTTKKPTTKKPKKKPKKEPEEEVER